MDPMESIGRLSNLPLILLTLPVSSYDRLDFRRFHRNRFVSNGSDGVHRTTFQPLQLLSTLPVTKCTRLFFRFSCTTRFHRTPGYVHRNLFDSIGHDWRLESCTFRCCEPFKPWYQITNSLVVFPYFPYKSSGEKLLKYQ